MCSKPSGANSSRILSYSMHSSMQKSLVAMADGLEERKVTYRVMYAVKCDD